MLTLKNPVLILALTLLIILFAPLVLKRFRIPGIIGLIIAGVIIGPNTLHIIEKSTSFELFSKTGLLYIMFLAGLEIDMQEYKQNRSKSLVFGALTFFIPIIIGYLVYIYVFHFPLWSSLLLASMFSTHTLDRVREADLHVCCGGIVGMGESRAQRAGLIAQLANMEKQPESVPINLLTQVEGTPLHGTEPLDLFEFVKTIAVARITKPSRTVSPASGQTIPRVG